MNAGRERLPCEWTLLCSLPNTLETARTVGQCCKGGKWEAGRWGCRKGRREEGMMEGRGRNNERKRERKEKKEEMGKREEGMIEGR